MKQVSKRSVNYRMAVRVSRSCGTCTMYHARRRACDLVRGEIASDAICDRWVAKEDKK